MKTNLIRILALSAAMAGAIYAQSADEAQVPQANAQRAGGASSSIVGVWDVSVTVVNCQTGGLIRNVHSVQMYQPDGAFTETTNTGTRGSSVGYWYRETGQIFGASYFFFRYNPDGSFASFAKAANKVAIMTDGSGFNVTATIQDYDANGNLVSTGCVTQTAKRL